MIPCLQHSPESILQQLLNRRGCGHSVVCVATMETGNKVSHYLKALCWPVVVLWEDEGGGEEDGNMEQLLQRETVVSESFSLPSLSLTHLYSPLPSTLHLFPPPSPHSFSFHLLFSLSFALPLSPLPSPLSPLPLSPLPLSLSPPLPSPTRWCPPLPPPSTSSSLSSHSF